jgi:hypothetical protein
MSVERESTQEWLLPARWMPPTVAELVERIDEALATARASEAAVMTVGAAALDAAEQAKRAAELAERASAAMNGRPIAGSTVPAVGEPSPPSHAGEGEMGDFNVRADRVAERLRRLQRLPLSA